MRNHQYEPVYVISVAARLAGLPCWVLRVLDQEGIVVPVRTDSNRRLYSDHDITVLARVRHLTEDRHVNIAGVKIILEMERERDAQRAPETGDPPYEARGEIAIAGNGAATPIALPPYPVTPTGSPI
jgi:MerR family transcriptional regulator/heat shock protein HspR